MLKDAACFEIARLQPADSSQFSRIKELSPGSIRRYGEAILDLLAEGRSADDSELPLPAPKPLTPAQTQCYKQFKAVAEEVADQLGVAPEVFVKKRDIEEVIRSARLPDALTTWRKPLIGDKLLALSEKKA